MKKDLLKVALIKIVLVLTSSCSDKPTDLVQFIQAPVGLDSSESHLHLTDDGTLLLSWIEPDSLEYSKLLFSKLDDNETWTEATTIARGNNWFINWADFPSISSFGRQNLVAHYLEKSADDTYTYDVKMSISNDYGKNWSKGFKAHTDNTKSEHGFVSKIAMDENSYLAIWLDGRQMAEAETDSTVISQMNLRGGIFDDKGERLNSFLMDDRVCECCQTGVAMTKNGPIAIYRNRSLNEVRDIYYTRLLDGKWTEPKAIFEDNWKIDGCPVNGPAISTHDSQVAIAWYTLASGFPEVKVVFSANNGEHFDIPISIDDTYPLGRVDIEMLNHNNAIVSWLDQVNNKTVIQLQRINSNGSKSKVFTVAESSESRSSGFPRMAVKKEKVYLSWTEVNGLNTTVKTAVLNASLID